MNDHMTALPGDWKLADHPEHGRVVVVRPEPDDEGEAAIIVSEPTNIDHAALTWCNPDELTYVDTNQETTDATPVKVGDIIESAADPRITALPDGSVLRDCDGETVAKRSGEWVGIGYIPIPSEGDEFGPWKVMRIGWETDQSGLGV